MKNLLLIFVFVLNFSLLSSGQITFQKTIGGINGDYGKAIQRTDDNGYIIVGYSGNFGGYNQIYLVKTDSLGDLIWSKAFASPLSATAFTVQQTTDLGYIIAGQTTGLSNGANEACLIKTDIVGSIVWTKIFGGNFNSVGYFVLQTNDGGYILAGQTTNYGFGLYNAYLIKTNDLGDTLWTKTFGGTTDDYAYCIRQTTDGGYILTGASTSFGSGGWDAFLIKTDVNGDSIWTKYYGGPNNDFGYSVQQTSDGGFIVAGCTDGFGMGSLDVYLFKTDSNGMVDWSKTYGGVDDDFAYYIQQTSDTGYVIVGSTLSFGFGSYDMYVIKTDFDGNLNWTKTYGGLLRDECFYCVQTNDKGYAFIGTTRSFGSGFDDICFIKTDQYGNSGCNESSTNTVVNSPSTIVTSFPLTLSAGAVVSSPVLVESSGGTILTNCFSVGINEDLLINSFSVYPNPSSGKFTIEFSELIQHGRIEIYNLIGKNIYSSNIEQLSSISISLKSISSGIYFVKITEKDQQFVKKIVVE